MATTNYMEPKTDAPEIFSLNGRYQVVPGTTATDLHNDIGCWLETIHGTLDVLADGLKDEGGQLALNSRGIALTLCGALYQLEMVQGALSAAHKLEQREVVV